jgi:hypothetical protein
MSRITWLASLALLASACGGGGGGSDAGGAPSAGGTPPPDTSPVQGLELPENFSVLAAKGENPGTGSGKLSGVNAKPGLSGTFALGSGPFGKLYSDSDTDYSTDEVNAYVYDRSMGSLDIINEIVCYMSQTAASQMVNRGPYVALVNEERCRQGENGSAGAETGQSSGGEGTQFARWVVDSQRADNDSDQLVRLWVPDEEDGSDELGPEQILVELVVSEGESDSRPFGSFVLNFKGVVDGAPLGQPGVEIEMMRGMLATVDNDAGSPQFRFVNFGGDALGLGFDVGFGFEEAANVRLADAEGNAGLARTRNAETWSFDGPSGPELGERQENYAIEYDSTRFSSSWDENGDAFGDELVCRARDEFDVRVWRYNLYHHEDGEFRGRDVTGGERVELNSGFPFSYDDGGDDIYGWMGYYGLWTETGDLLDDGQTIHGFDYDSDETVDYTVRIAPGRLIRRSANQEMLAAFVGDEFQYWGQHPALEVFGQWLVAVDQSLDFQVTSTFAWGEGGPEYSSTIDHDNDPQTDEVPVAAAFDLQDREVLWLWSESLGGNVVYTHDLTLAAESRGVTFFAEEYVTAQDEILFPSGTSSDTLYCYGQCLIGGLTQADVDLASAPHDLYHPYSGQAFTYTLSAANGKVVLIDDTTGEAVSATSLEMAALGHEWGINTGEMLAEALAYPDQPWLVYEQPVSYRWETGPNIWNLMVTATDASGATVDFDRPLQISYAHSLVNDANGSAEYHGKRFMLQYGGAGDLHGFPWLEDGNSGHWYPAVTLADGVVLGEGDVSFIVKAVEKEQSMRELEAGECSGLDADSAYSDPSLGLPAAGDIGAVSFALSDRPQVEGPPAVIEGVVQGGAD